jgi:hypothetical protein
MRKEWRNRRVTVEKMISSAKRGFPTLAEFGAKRKMIKKHRHADTLRQPPTGEHSNIRKNSQLQM